MQGLAKKTYGFAHKSKAFVSPARQPKYTFEISYKMSKICSMVIKDDLPLSTRSPLPIYPSSLGLAWGCFSNPFRQTSTSLQAKSAACAARGYGPRLLSVKQTQRAEPGLKSRVTCRSNSVRPEAALRALGPMLTKPDRKSVV